MNWAPFPVIVTRINGHFKKWKQFWNWTSFYTKNFYVVRQNCHAVSERRKQNETKVSLRPGVNQSRVSAKMKAKTGPWNSRKSGNYPEVRGNLESLSNISPQRPEEVSKTRWNSQEQHEEEQQQKALQDMRISLLLKTVKSLIRFFLLFGAKESWRYEMEGKEERWKRGRVESFYPLQGMWRTFRKQLSKKSN